MSEADGWKVGSEPKGYKKEYPETPVEDLQEILIETLCIYLKSDGLSYTIVDMDLDSGNGAVIEKNIPLANYTSSCNYSDILHQVCKISSTTILWSIRYSILFTQMIPIY